MIQLGKKRMCRNCVYFDEAEQHNWTYMYVDVPQRKHHCTCPNFEHVVTHSRNRCKNGQFVPKLKD